MCRYHHNASDQLVIVDEQTNVDPKVYDHVVSPPVEEDPFDSPEYQEFVNDLASECKCGCAECGNSPCDGLLAGGLCDGMGCTCNEYEDDDFYINGDDEP